MRKNILIMALMAIFALSTQSVEAQKVTREGNTFTQVSNKSTRKPLEETATPTEYQYVDSKGKVYKVFLTPSGKAFVWRTHQKTGELYPQYLPEIGKQINPSAYQPKKEEKEDK